MAAVTAILSLLCDEREKNFSLIKDGINASNNLKNVTFQAEQLPNE